MKNEIIRLFALTALIHAFLLPSQSFAIERKASDTVTACSQELDTYVTLYQNALAQGDTNPEYLKWIEETLASNPICNGGSTSDDIAPYFRTGLIGEVAIAGVFIVGLLKTAALTYKTLKRLDRAIFSKPAPVNQAQKSKLLGQLKKENRRSKSLTKSLEKTNGVATKKVEKGVEKLQKKIAQLERKVAKLEGRAEKAKKLNLNVTCDSNFGRSTIRHKASNVTINIQFQNGGSALLDLTLEERILTGLYRNSFGDNGRIGLEVKQKTIVGEYFSYENFGNVGKLNFNNCRRN